MVYGSMCSGIEAATVAWEPLGWEPAWFSEIEPGPCSVLQHHYPEVPNLGDLTTIHDNPVFAPVPLDLLVAGTPCQGFSVAGLRKGLDDDRSNLCLTFVKLVLAKRPRWVVWENVPGVFTTGKGQDFCDFLSGLSGVDLSVPDKGWKNSGVVVGAKGFYSLAWRVLDAQHFGVPQRRRRVFVVGHLGDWRCAAAVLFERESLQGHPPPSREKREDTTLSVSYGIDEECNPVREGFGPLLRGGQGGTRQSVATFSPSSHGGYGERGNA
jgi:DNA (cytosine-5)-methyltransferase 1